MRVAMIGILYADEGIAAGTTDLAVIWFKKTRSFTLRNDLSFF